jgi:hypothetical protein
MPSPGLAARQLDVPRLRPRRQAESAGAGDQGAEHGVEGVVALDAGLAGTGLPDEPRRLLLDRGQERFAGERARLLRRAGAALVADSAQPPAMR